MAIDTSSFKTGLTIVQDGEVWQIVEFQHVKPGKGGAFVRTKLKQVKSGKTVDKTFRAGEKMEQAILERRQMHSCMPAASLHLHGHGESFDRPTCQHVCWRNRAQYLTTNAVLFVWWGTQYSTSNCPTSNEERPSPEPTRDVRANTASGRQQTATIGVGAV